MPTRRILKQLIGGVCAAVVIFIFFCIAVLHNKYVPPVLMYHSVNPTPAAGRMLTVSVETFRRQMHFLKAHRYNVIPLEELAALVKEKKKIPPRTLALTFDDGYVDNYTYAFPILKQYALPATLFIIVNEVGRAQNDRLNWGQIKEMQSSGLVTIGSHTMGPEPLINLKSEADVKNEIFSSKKALEYALGRDVRAFSYPEGKFNGKIRQLVIDAGYTLAVATSPGKQFPGDDVYLLKRLRISENAKNLFVFWFETSGYYNFIKERRHK
jgi:peptidoglycan/xylan/chitin deacetylase (PgdA/CDA1 family)